MSDWSEPQVAAAEGVTGTQVSNTDPAGPTDTATAADWNAAWASSLLEAANYFSVTLPDWLVATDRFNGVNGLPELPTLAFEIPTNGVQFLNYTTELNNIYNQRPLYQPTLASVGDKLAELEDFTRLPYMNPSDPGLTTIEPIAFDGFTDVAPVYEEPTVPGALATAAPTKSFTIQPPNMPSSPNVEDIPDVPSFDALNVPTIPVMSLPTYSGTAPQNQLTPPTDQFAFVDAEYVSELRDPLVAKLLDNLTNGGYGIETADEIQIWNRARDRETQAAQTKIAEVTRQNAAFSFPLPQGSLYAAINAAHQEMQEKLASLNREVALKRADMYVENRKFTIQQIQQYEKMDRDFYSSVQERALNVAKAMVELAIQRFDAEVKNYNTKLDAYKAGAQVFEALIRAELSKVEVYKAQIEGENLRLGFNKAKVDLYLGQLQGIRAKVDIYKVQVDAVVAQMQAEETKIRTFEAEVRAYVAQVGAKETEWNAYTAAIRGQEEKLGFFKTKFDVYKQAQEEKVKQKEWLITVNDQKLKEYRLGVENYKDRLETVSRQIQDVLEANKLDLASYDSRVKVFDILIAALRDNVRIQLETHKLNAANVIAQNKSQADAVKFALEKLDKQISLVDKVDARGMEYYRTLLGTTLSNVNALAVTSA